MTEKSDSSTERSPSCEFVVAVVYSALHSSCRQWFGKESEPKVITLSDIIMINVNAALCVSLHTIHFSSSETTCSARTVWCATCAQGYI